MEPLLDILSRNKKAKLITTKMVVATFVPLIPYSIYLYLSRSHILPEAIARSAGSWLLLVGTVIFGLWFVWHLPVTPITKLWVSLFYSIAFGCFLYFYTFMFVVLFFGF
jgi:hypothetical protein